MKTLEGHTILYDDECPMCSNYTQAFIKTGMLDNDGRQAFTAAYACNLPNVDWNRARNEIAVINKNDNTVQYGVDGILEILAHNAKWLRALFSFKPIQFLVRRLYLFISFNRKVIAPGKVFVNVCTPDLNYTYRWAYILFAWLVTSTTLVYYSMLLAPLISPTNFIREFLICGGQIVFQGAIILFVRKKRCIHYLGNMMTISLAGALLLIPMLLILPHLFHCCCEFNVSRTHAKGQVIGASIFYFCFLGCV
jgi:predicted DCC family thiol-disulfide oxidoreductase YuxK